MAMALVYTVYSRNEHGGFEQIRYDDGSRSGSSPVEAMKFVDPDRKELDIAYHFESVDIGIISMILVL
jgi:hypothetical protein